MTLAAATIAARHPNKRIKMNFFPVGRESALSLHLGSDCAALLSRLMLLAQDYHYFTSEIESRHDSLLDVSSGRINTA
jgi:hypothetical protein